MVEDYILRMGDQPSFKYTDSDGNSVSVQFERVHADVPDSPHASEPVLVPAEPDPEILDSSKAMEYLREQERQYGIKIRPRSAIEIVEK